MMNFKKNEKYASIAFHAGITVIVCAVVIMCLIKFDTAVSVIKRFLSVISPLTYGFVFAYLFNPILNFYEKKVFAFKNAKKDRRTLRRVLSLICMFLTIILVTSVLLYTVIPQTVKSLEDLGSQLNTYITNIQKFADNMVSKYSDKLLGKQIETMAALLAEYDIKLSIKDALSVSYSLLQNGFDYAVNYGTAIGNQIINLLMGLIVAVYFLIFKEKISAQTKKLLNAFMSRRAYLNTVRLARYTHGTFGSFIVGKLIDSVIIGLMSFLLLWIFRIPYYPLLAVLIGITNIVPTFGPIIGGVFGTMLLLLISPEKALMFLILVIVIQQIDGNIIGPKILGNSIGISALWVVIAIIVCGGMFGFVGMIVGVPATAVIYTLVKQWTEKRLKHKKYPVHTAYYATDPPACADKLDEGQVFIDKDTPVDEPSAGDDIEDPPKKEKKPFFKSKRPEGKSHKQKKGQK